MTVNGTLELSGELSGGGAGKNFSGQTNGNHARLLLGKSSKINVVGGTILSYGFIYETEKNNGSEINLDNASNLTQPLVVRDHRGGSYMYGVYDDMGTSSSDKAASPFSRFHFVNVSPKITFAKGATMKAWANLYAGDQQNVTTVTMIGTGSDAVIQLNNDMSYIKAKYDVDTQVCNLDIYGGAAINSMIIEIKLGLFGSQTISTANCFFPITCYFHVTLNQAHGQTETAVYSSTNRFKIMPGGSLTVSEGASFSADKIMVYETFIDEHPNSPYPQYKEPYPTSNDAGKYASGFVGTAIEPGKLVVEGTLSVGSLGGKLTATNAENVTITSAGYCTSYEPITAAGKTTNAKIVEYLTLSSPAILNGEYVWYNGAWCAMDSENVAELYMTDNAFIGSTGSLGTISQTTGLDTLTISYTFTQNLDGKVSVTISVYVKVQVDSTSRTVTVSGTDSYTAPESSTSGSSIFKKYYSSTTITVTEKTEIVIGVSA